AAGAGKGEPVAARARAEADAVKKERRSGSMWQPPGGECGGTQPLYATPASTYSRRASSLRFPWHASLRRARQRPIRHPERGPAMRRREFLKATGLAAGALGLKAAARADEPREERAVAIRVRADQPAGELRPIWRFFGADEPNYAYMKDGEQLL